MPKSEVILVHNIVGLGAESDQVKVAAGYARNYLFPRRLAIPLNAANKKRLESLRQRRAEREAADLNSMSEVAASIGKLPPLKIAVKTGDDGKMFGAVTSGTIADELKTQFGIALDKKKIHLDQPIRTLGEHEVAMRLHPDVNATLKVLVESTTPPAPVTPEVPATAPTEPRGARRGDRYFGRYGQARAAAAAEKEKAAVAAKAPAAAAKAPVTKPAKGGAERPPKGGGEKKAQ
jgi:large subunit ribosomal protein L9